MERLLGFLLPRKKAGALAADYDEFRAGVPDSSGWPIFLYKFDLVFYGFETAIRRRLRIATLSVRRETRRDPYLYAGLFWLLPHLYLFCGLFFYFVTGGGAWLALSGHYPLELNFTAALSFSMSAIIAAGCLLASIVARGSLVRRLPQLALGWLGILLSGLLHYGSFY